MSHALCGAYQGGQGIVREVGEPRAPRAIGYPEAVLVGGRGIHSRAKQPGRLIVPTPDVRAGGRGTASWPLSRFAPVSGRGDGWSRRAGVEDVPSWVADPLTEHVVAHSGDPGLGVGLMGEQWTDSVRSPPAKVSMRSLTTRSLFGLVWCSPVRWSARTAAGVNRFGTHHPRRRRGAPGAAGVSRALCAAHNGGHGMAPRGGWAAATGAVQADPGRSGKPGRSGG